MCVLCVSMRVRETARKRDAFVRAQNSNERPSVRPTNSDLPTDGPTYRPSKHQMTRAWKGSRSGSAFFPNPRSLRQQRERQQQQQRQQQRLDQNCGGSTAPHYAVVVAVVVGVMRTIYNRRKSSRTAQEQSSSSSKSEESMTG